MVSLSSSPKEYTFEEKEILDLIATLTRMPGFKRLAEVIEAEREKYFANLARELGRGSWRDEPVNQRFIDERRGFWQGAMWAVQALPKIKTREWDKFVENATREDEDTE